MFRVVLLAGCALRSGLVAILAQARTAPCKALRPWESACACGAALMPSQA